MIHDIKSNKQNFNKLEVLSLTTIWFKLQNYWSKAEFDILH